MARLARRTRMVKVGTMAKKTQWPEKQKDQNDRNGLNCPSGEIE